MNNDEAKFLLQAYRPHGQDAGDPALAKALAQAGRDPALRAWQAREQAFDLLIAEKLATVAPPPDLRAAILAGGRATRPERAWWQTRWLAVAASFALLLAVVGGGRLLFSGTAPQPTLGQFALDDTLHGKHGGKGEPMGALQALLGQPSTRLGAGLPVDFAALEATGCRTLSLGGHPLLEVCFQREGAVYHLYIMRAGDLREAAGSSSGPELLAQGGASAASWRDGQFAYALVGTGGMDAVKHLL